MSVALEDKAAQAPKLKPKVDEPAVPYALPTKERTRLLRKVDLNVVRAHLHARRHALIHCGQLPIVTLMYLMSFLDRGNIGNAKIAGLPEDLNLSSKQYAIAASMMYVSYVTCEVRLPAPLLVGLIIAPPVTQIPSNLLLKKVTPSKWLPSICLLWGMCVLACSPWHLLTHVSVTVTTGLVQQYPGLVAVRLALGFVESGLVRRPLSSLVTQPC